MLALVVEDVLLLTIEVFDGEPIDRQLRRAAIHAWTSLSGISSSSGSNQADGLRRLGEENLHLLAAAR